MKLMIFMAAAAGACAVQPAMAQNVCPAGSSLAVIRLSKLVPAGTMDGARKAAADHAAW